MEICPKCGGSGQVPAPPIAGMVPTPGSREVNCPRCGGEGEIVGLDPGEVPVPADEALSRRRGGVGDVAGYSDGDAVTVPDPNNVGARIRATFKEVAVGEPIDGRDAVWVRYDEGPLSGTTGKVPYYRIHPA